MMADNSGNKQTQSRHEAPRPTPLKHCNFPNKYKEQKPRLANETKINGFLENLHLLKNKTIIGKQLQVFC